MNKTSRFYYLLIILTVTTAINSRASEILEQAPGPEVRLLTIQEAIQMTLAHAPEMHIVEAQEKRAGEAVRETRSLIKPQVATGTGIAYNNGFPLSIEGSAPSIFQVGLSQSIFSKQNKNLIREAEEAGKASSFNRESTGNELVLRTALAYFRLLQARKMVSLAEERFHGSEEYLLMAQALSEAGRMRPVDVSSAKMAVSSARQQLLIVREEADIAEAELKTYTGIQDGISLRMEEPVLVSPLLNADAETLYQQSLKNYPEIQKAESDIRAKEFHLEAAKGERLPKVNLVGQYAVLSKANNYEDFFNRFERNNYLLGFSIQIPIFDGFRTSARVAQSRQEISAARYRLESVKSDLKLDVRRGVSAYRIASGAEEHARNDAVAVRERIKLDEQLLQSGRISQMEFEEIKAGLFQKELVHLEAEQVLFQRKMEILNITGAISSSFQ